MSRSSGARPPSQRQLRVGERVRQLLAECFMRGELHDPRLSGLNITVSEVRMSTDLRHATAYVSELGVQISPESLKLLNHATPQLAGIVGRQINLKYAPKIHFVADESFDRAARLDAMLDEALAPHLVKGEPDDGA